MVDQDALAKGRVHRGPMARQVRRGNGVRIKGTESAHPDQMWAMRVHPVFHHNIIRCLHRDEFPRQQRSKFHWVPDWTSYHCIGSVGEKESEEEEGSKKVTERWLRGCLLQPSIDDSSYRQVTLSFTAASSNPTSLSSSSRTSSVPPNIPSPRSSFMSTVRSEELSTPICIGWSKRVG